MASVGGNRCVVCRKSVLHRRSYLLTERQAPAHIPVVRQIALKIQPRLISQSDHCCFGCWLNARKKAKRLQNEAQYQANDDKTGSNNASEYQDNGTETDTNVEATRSLPQRITLSSYKRVKSSSSYCIFPQCANLERLRVPREIREKLLMDYKLYVPENSRICLFHRNSNLWEILSSTVNSRSEFSANFIEDAFALLTSASSKPRPTSKTKLRT